MSTDSLSTETEQPPSPPVDLSAGSDLADLAAKFTQQDFPHFHVEYRDEGNDLIYHFWPPEDAQEFVTGFHLHLEAAFVDTVPSAEVHAHYTDLEEARLKLKEGVGLVPQRDFREEFVKARETYYVRVLDGLANPMAEKFLTERLFGIIETHINRSL